MRCQTSFERNFARCLVLPCPPAGNNGLLHTLTLGHELTPNSALSNAWNVRAENKSKHDSCILTWSNLSDSDFLTCVCVLQCGKATCQSAVIR